MNTLLGTTPAVFFGMSCLLFGFAAFMTGQAVANTWKPVWHAITYCLLLGLGSRFLIYGLFQGKLLSLTGYLADIAVLIAIALFAFRITRARKMINQYPWLYERVGLFGWRNKKA